jgi:small-conductance mechanosensitive channel
MLRGLAANDALAAGAIFAASVVAAVTLRFLWKRLVVPLMRRTRTHFDDAVLAPMGALTIWGVLLLGAYYSLRSLDAINSRPQLAQALRIASNVAWVVLIVRAVLTAFNGVLKTYVRDRASAGRDASIEAGLIRKAGYVVVLALGAFYLLRVIGANLSPLLAGGAIGGLAVALALQDTLSNLFAGFYLSIDKPIAVGDFVKLESGQEGFVEDVGWRNTKIRLWANNVVVIPNSKLIQSVLTNYFLPEQAMSVYVSCGVSYDSDLEQVERVTVEVAQEVMQRVAGADTEWTPVVRWQRFDDFAIAFVTVLRVREFGAQYALQSEFIKAIHRRFREEGIEIPFPIRTVMFKHAPTPEALTARAGLTGAAWVPPEDLNRGGANAERRAASQGVDSHDE